MLFMPAVLLSAFVTLAALILCVFMAIHVSRARRTYQTPPPTQTGDPKFERTVRAHENMTEALVVFLPSLWLATLYFQGWIPGIIGIVWIVGRVLYWPGYISAADKRLPGFIIAQLCSLALIVLAAIGVISKWMVV